VATALGHYVKPTTKKQRELLTEGALNAIWQFRDMAAPIIIWDMQVLASMPALESIELPSAICRNICCMASGAPQAKL
jgi:hypothetical protein